MLKIGLTGGIGSGKSEASRILSELGALVIDADIVGHETYRSGEPAFRGVVEAFGDGIVGSDGEIDRRQLGSIVFANPDNLARLTGIVWPKIREHLEKIIERAGAQRETHAIVVEAAVLFEAGWENLFDEVWVITASEDEVLKRLEIQRNQKPEQTRARVRAQMTNDERERRADVTVRNDEDRAVLAARVTRLWTDRTRKGLSK